MPDATQQLKDLLNKSLTGSPTFSDEMIKKIQEELKKAAQDAVDYETKKAETDKVSA